MRTGGAGHARDRVRQAIAWAPPLLIGLWLRTTGLGEQVLIGDERWEIAAALERDVIGLFRHLLVAGANYSPPLAAVHRTMLASGLAPGELLLRTPSWVCGVLVMAGVPFALRRRLPRDTVLLLAWLLALSPLLVFYTRMVRGYAPLVLLGAVTTIASLRWIESGSRRALAAWAIAAGLAASTNLLALPFVLAPLGVAAIAVARGRAAAGGRAWLGLALAVGASITLFLAPATESILRLLAERGGEGRPGLGAAGATLVRLAGVGSPVLASILYALAILGAARLRRRSPVLAAVAGAQIASQLVAVAWVGPVGADQEILYARYVMIALPTLLVLVAAGATPAAGAAPGPRRVAHGAAAAGLLALFLGGPLSRPVFLDGSFVHAWAHRGWSDLRPVRPTLESEGFYASLRDRERAGPVVETLWHGVVFPDVAPAHQRVHGQRVIVASLLDVWWDDPRLDLRNALPTRRPGPEELLASAGRWAVVHVDPRAEAEAIRGDAPEWAQHARNRRLLAFAAREEQACRALARDLVAAWGAPDHRDRWIAAWDLDRLRGHGRAASSPR